LAGGFWRSRDHRELRVSDRSDSRCRSSVLLGYHPLKSKGHPYYGISSIRKSMKSKPLVTVALPMLARSARREPSWPARIPNRPPRARIRRWPAGFTLIELLVVITVVAVLAVMGLPALAKSKARAPAVSCLNSLKQLQLGWLMYSSDNYFLVPNVSANETGLGWVDGNVVTGKAGGDITNGLLFAYIKNPDVYKCPGDILSGHDRSRTMNGWIGSDNAPARNSPGQIGGVQGQPHLGDPNGLVFKKQSDFVGNASPSMIFVFVDENPNSINDGYFVDDCWNGQVAQAGIYVDFPGCYHNNAAGLSFADGHAEMRQWTDPEILAQTANGRGAPESPPSADLQWLTRHSSVLQSQQ
jgi:prepilin-type N-terminal cleavage/methylation domain-containing protein/prepilin-type processing-associated H-X9-DG protein